MVSWLFLKGKCRYCKAPVSIRYPLTELFYGVLVVLALLKWDLSPVLLRNLVLFACLFTLSLVDLEIYEIPDGCLILAGLAWILAEPFCWEGWAMLAHHLGSGLVLGGLVLVVSLVMDKVLGRESMGGGDIKLFAVLGLYLGGIGGLLALFLSCIFGLVFFAIGLKKNEEKQIPFGPSIAAALTLVLFIGDPIVSWYLSLL